MLIWMLLRRVEKGDVISMGFKYELTFLSFLSFIMAKVVKGNLREILDLYSCEPADENVHFTAGVSAILSGTLKEFFLVSTMAMQAVVINVILLPPSFSFSAAAL